MTKSSKCVSPLYSIPVIPLQAGTVVEVSVKGIARFKMFHARVAAVLVLQDSVTVDGCNVPKSTIAPVARIRICFLETFFVPAFRIVLPFCLFAFCNVRRRPIGRFVGGENPFPGLNHSTVHDVCD
jgi:hypothetical protein